nr:Type 1 glutamine amidotransferase-like domain-containing protein [uncultured Anaerostipes sp.]
MKEMLLVSMLQHSADLVKKVEPDLAGKVVTYIPTAGIAEEIEGMVEEETETLSRLGLKVDVLEISTASHQKMKESLINNDLIFVGGGNTFFLLQELRRTGADQILTDQVNNGKLYIGESAGAIVACPDIGYSAEIDSVEKAPDLKDYTGLNLVDFYLVPHIDNEGMGPGAKRIIEKYSDQMKMKVLRDDQAIWIEGSEITIL